MDSGSDDTLHCPPPQTSVDTVEVLLKKHEEFEKSCAPHDEKIKLLCDLANRLITAGHYESGR